MLKVRSPYALPFAVLASLAAACGGSSASTTDSGTPEKDTGTVTTHDTGTTTADTGTKADAGVVKDSGKTSADTGMTLPDASGGGDASTGTPPVVPATAKALVKGFFVQVIGLTSDDYLVYYDSKGGVSATDINGTITQIAPGPTTDGGIGPTVVGLGGQVVAILTDYTTKTVQGTAEPVEGTLSIWTHTLNKLTQVATNSTGIINIADDSSIVIYADGSDSTGTKGNIGVVSTAAGSTGTDIVKGVVIDTSSTSCAPFAIADKAYVVTSTCALLDGGNAKPQISSFNGASNWAEVTLATNAGTSSPYNTPYAVNFTTDTAGTSVIVVGSSPATVDGGKATADLTVQGIASTMPNTLITPYGVPVSGGTDGSEFFYVSKAGTFAFWTQPNANLGYASFTTPGGTPMISTPSTDVVLGVQVISPDENYDVDYSTALDMNTGAPSKLNLRKISTGKAVALTNGSGLATTFGGQNSFTADSTYVIFTASLKSTGAAGASIGTLYTAAVATGTVNQIVTNQTVWNANPLTGANLIYNQNYIPSMFMTPNGAASADVYVQAASGTGNGTLVVTGADAADYFYITADKSHMFFTFSNVAVDSSGNGTAFPTDGLYSIALPAAP